jgi:hypothetical protein
VKKEKKAGRRKKKAMPSLNTGILSFEKLETYMCALNNKDIISRMTKLPIQIVRVHIVTWYFLPHS